MATYAGTMSQRPLLPRLVKCESEEDAEDVPKLSHLYALDEEQYYSVRGGAGPSSSEREYDYAVLDWQKK